MGGWYLKEITAVKQPYPSPRTILVPSIWPRRLLAPLVALTFAVAAVFGAMVLPATAQAAPSTYSIWSASSVPAQPADSDTASTELGVRFRASSNGWVTAIRFYKFKPNAAPHTGTLWSSSGTALAKVTFTAESASGWQEATLTTPVRLAKDTDYVASYRAPKGRYAADSDRLSPTRPITTQALTATQGVYNYGTGMPSSTWQDANYYVDVVFTPATTATATTATTATATPTSPTTTTATTTTATTATSTTATSTTTTATTTTATTATSLPSAGYPSAANTGVPAGITLSNSGSLTVDTPGAVIDALNISGTVAINASNVTLKRSRITGSGYAMIRVADSAQNVLIQDVEINGSGLSGSGNSGGVIGPATVQRANIWGVENGLVPGSGSALSDNYIHGLAAPGSPHIDGIQIDGGLSNITIEHNTIDMQEWSQTSAVMIDNYFGPIDTVSVNNNRLLGGGYTVYSDGQFSGGTIKGVSFTNNRLGRGYWGYASFNANQPVWSNNLDDKTSAVITN